MGANLDLQSAIGSWADIKEYDKRVLINSHCISLNRNQLTSVVKRYAGGRLVIRSNK